MFLVFLLDTAFEIFYFFRYSQKLFRTNYQSGLELSTEDTAVKRQKYLLSWNLNSVKSVISSKRKLYEVLEEYFSNLVSLTVCIIITSGAC